MNGHEYFAHAWELGARKAKEILFTGSAVTAKEARAIGMIDQVVPGGADAALEMATRIVQMPALGLKLAKQAVNQSLDAQGQWTALQAAMNLHEVGHSHSREILGDSLDPAGAARIRQLSEG